MLGSSLHHLPSVEVPLVRGTFCVDINIRQKGDQDKPSPI